MTNEDFRLDPDRATPQILSKRDLAVVKAKGQIFITSEELLKGNGPHNFRQGQPKRAIVQGGDGLSEELL